MSFGWLLPLLVTIAAFVRAVLVFRRQTPAGGFLGPFNIVIAIALLVLASAVSLVAWLAYFMWLVFG